ncbi:MAG: DUF2007 domain-containing protein [Spirosomataceae bacterium]
MAPKNWEKVFETTFQHQAEITRDYLEQQEIPTVVINKKDSSYHFGRFELYVP